MRKIALVFAVVLLIYVFSLGVFAAPSDTKVGSILDNATRYNGNYYLLITGSYTWQQAKVCCEGLGGHLATITSQSEDDVCFQMWKNSGTKGCWLGASDLNIEGIWEWVTGEQWDYSNWGGNEPNGGTAENMLGYYGNYPVGRWNDSSANNEHAFICEWEKENIDDVKNTFGFITGSNIIYNNAFYYNGHAYNIFNYDMKWDEAKNYCEKLGGHMAIISTIEENKALFSYVTLQKSYKSVFGATDSEQEGLWKWVSGDTMTYSNWGEGEPNNTNGVEDYVHFLSTFDGKWNDTIWQNSFICEWDDCCILPNGTVTEHSLTEPKITKPATCTTVGELKRICRGCGAEIKEISGIKTHPFGEWKITSEATCHSGEKKERKCGTCGYIEKQDIAMLAHEWGQWTVYVPATCYASGVSERYCDKCGDKEQQTIEQLTHNYGEYIVVSGNRFIPPIVREKTCSLCNDVQTYRDWSNVWITVLIGVALIGVVAGLVNYIKAFKKR